MCNAGLVFPRESWSMGFAPVCRLGACRFSDRAGLHLPCQADWFPIMMGSFYFVVVILNKISWIQYKTVAFWIRLTWEQWSLLPYVQYISASTPFKENLDPTVGSEGNYHYKWGPFTCSWNLYFFSWEVCSGSALLASGNINFVRCLIIAVIKINAVP